MSGCCRQDPWVLPPLLAIVVELEALARLDVYNGMLPCFFGGRSSRLPSSLRNERPTMPRVCEGSITSVMYPREAAMYGDANSRRYCKTNSARFALGSSAFLISSL